jgi:probable FeS assembly SUF system protein SufT
VDQRVINTHRDCTARLVPTGDLIEIPKGTFLTLSQELGGTYTIIINGNMARIDALDADALGFEPLVLSYETPADGNIDLEQVQHALQTVYDPEIPVNIVDLGLIYRCETDTQKRINIDMTLTSPGCGMGPVLVEDVKTRLSNVPNVSEVNVVLVFEPPWSRDMMTEEAQLELGLF